MSKLSTKVTATLVGVLLTLGLAGGTASAGPHVKGTDHVRLASTKYM